MRLIPIAPLVVAWIVAAGCASAPRTEWLSIVDVSDARTVYVTVSMSRSADSEHFQEVVTRDVLAALERFQRLEVVENPGDADLHLHVEVGGAPEPHGTTPNPRNSDPWKCGSSRNVRYTMTKADGVIVTKIVGKGRTRCDGNILDQMNDLLGRKVLM